MRVALARAVSITFQAEQDVLQASYILTLPKTLTKTFLGIQ